MIDAWKVSKDNDLKGICSTSFASEEVFQLFREVQGMLTNGEMTLSAHISKKVVSTKRKLRDSEPNDAPAIANIKKHKAAAKGTKTTKFKRQNKSNQRSLASFTSAASSQLDARVTNSITPENMGYIFNVRDQGYLLSVLMRVTTKELSVKEVIAACRNRCAHAWLCA